MGGVGVFIKRHFGNFVGITSDLNAQMATVYLFHRQIRLYIHLCGKNPVKVDKKIQHWGLVANEDFANLAILYL